MSKTIYVRGGQPVCRHGGGDGWAWLVGVIIGGVVLFESSKPHKAAHPAPVPPAPAPPPKVITITHHVTKVVHDHPFLSGWQFVVVVAILAVMVVGGLSVARHLRP
jgi:hypothetical protein